MKRDRIRLSVILTTIFAALVAGCAMHQSTAQTPAEPGQSGAQMGAQTTVQSGMQPSTQAGPAADQMQFDSPDAAVTALKSAAAKQDAGELRKIFGPAWDDLQSGDPVADAKSLKSFSQHVSEQLRAEATGDDIETVFVGKNDWPMPIPLMKSDAGKWYFDTTAGKADILARKVGRNELAAIDGCRAYVFAQRQYASTDHDNSGVLKYAQRFVSHPGKQDGLFWPAEEGAPESPLGPLVAQATLEGYGPIKGAVHRPFHGYFFRILTKQGPDAPGGKYDYVINGNMIAGFALIAWPDKYGSSGVMTFIVNHQGQVFQKDLGPDTDAIARSIKEYNPDKSWTAVK